MLHVCIFTVYLQIILNSMHKYQPRVHIVRTRHDSSPIDNIDSDDCRTFTFGETVFTAVTAYQNQLVSLTPPFCAFSDPCTQLLTSSDLEIFNPYNYYSMNEKIQLREDYTIIYEI